MYNCNPNHLEIYTFFGTTLDVNYLPTTGWVYYPFKKRFLKSNSQNCFPVEFLAASIDFCNSFAHLKKCTTYNIFSNRILELFGDFVLRLPFLWSWSKYWSRLRYEKKLIPLTLRMRTGKPMKKNIENMLSLEWQLCQ